ncbi:MAG TPA: DmsC/YnfH family molybdoenzyme membrane anchor subunit [Stellaceae bacterium]|nr:DmsC/YnfH family molybdoenzyme membrane anchor subunit [Stellaceae bacterium]
MYPTLSIIFFTTASGAGFALLLLVGIAAPLGALPLDPGFAAAILGAAFVLAVGGLFSSVFHLGRPERAWRAFSQWRTSWLSREGVFSVATFFPALAFAIGWIFFGDTTRAFGLCGLLAAALAAATICCTGMIYASLRPIRQWHNPWVVPNYVALGLMAGALVLDFVLRFWVPNPRWPAALAIVMALLAWWLKETYWRSIDTRSSISTVESATALGRRGRVRLLEPPNTEENYLLREMGFHIARKHARRLRRIAELTAFLLPLLLTIFALVRPGEWATLAAGIAIVSAALGLVVERWLFFAEATHTVMLYYGAETV